LKSSNGEPIAEKVLEEIKKNINRKIVDFSDLKKAKVHAANLEKTVISEKKLADYDPLHGIYVYAQNKISVLVEQLAGLPALAKLTKAYGEAEDEYLPSGPPMSPLTTSYFSCWGFFDLCIGLKKESFATVAIDLCRYFKIDPGLIKVCECMRDSRMGFYVHEGVSGNFVFLRELIAQNQIKVIVPSGYLGRPGEIWLARIMPEPFPELKCGYEVVFTTPYIIAEMKDGRLAFAKEKDWIAFFDRNLDKTKIKEKKRAYEFFMKYGLNRLYWNEYIFEGYVNHIREMIMLRGFPDIPLSLPHSKASRDGER